MERDGRMRSAVLNAVAATLTLAAISCSKTEQETELINTTICIGCGEPVTRSIDPEEFLLTDISIIIFDENGDAEECVWLSGGKTRHTTTLLKGRKYTICACANFGYQVYADNISELEEITFHMAYPDEYREGIPMYARREVTLTEDSETAITLERLMAKISIRMDRSRLSDGVQMNVLSARIGNCPRYTKVFTDNRVKDENGCFPAGFFRDELQTSVLNSDSGGGVSKEISLYMLENMQGDMPSSTNEDSDKIFDNDDLRSKICSYIEMEVEYLSETYTSGESGLIYRFYLGEDRNNLDVIRNSHYHITITPLDNGLAENSWRVDKSGLTYIGPTDIIQYPSSYIEGEIGDTIHIWCDLTPEEAPFDVGISYMEDDKRNGIYDYQIDNDGHGAVLTLKGPGAGLIYMEAGPPINDGVLFYIIVNEP